MKFFKKIISNKKCKTLKQIFFVVLLGFFSFSFIQPVDASFIGSAKKKFEKTGQTANVGEDEKDLGTMVGKGIKIALQLVGVILLIFLVYAGFLWMTSRGEEDKIKKARGIIINTIIGAFIVITAYAITALITGTIT
ncbi:MAG: hypothetical protein ABEJ24_00095 [Candidatus Magasanikbacteria bacterium]